MHNPQHNPTPLPILSSPLSIVMHKWEAEGLPRRKPSSVTTVNLSDLGSNSALYVICRIVEAPANHCSCLSVHPADNMLFMPSRGTEHPTRTTGATTNRHNLPRLVYVDQCSAPHAFVSLRDRSSVWLLLLLLLDWWWCSWCFMCQRGSDVSLNWINLWLSCETEWTEALLLPCLSDFCTWTIVSITIQEQLLRCRGLTLPLLLVGCLKQ